jgi:hypothetical protein
MTDSVDNLAAQSLAPNRLLVQIGFGWVAAVVLSVFAERIF